MKSISDIFRRSSGRSDRGEARREKKRVPGLDYAGIKRARNVRSDYDLNMLPGGEENSPVIIKTGPDTLFLVLCVILTLIGTVMSFSASTAYSEVVDDGNPFYFINERLKHLFVGLLVCVTLIIALTPRRAKQLAVVMYCGSVALLVLVFFIGTTGGGAKRWLNLGFFTLQPSELAKTGLIMLMAWYMTRNEDVILAKKGGWRSFVRGLVIPGFLLLIICGLVAGEHHFSGVIIIAFIGLAMMFISGTKFWCFAAMIPLAAVVGVFMWITPYSRARIESWVNRGADVLGADWQTTQGLYAIGTGGLFGLGLGQSRLKYGYVSQPQNDFVFTVVCEELGFFGALIIILLVLALVGRGLVLAMHAADKFCSLVICGLSFKIAIHFILNVGVVTGVLPNTGISMPFFSSGGTAVVVQMLDLGILLGLSRYCTQNQ